MFVGVVKKNKARSMPRDQVGKQTDKAVFSCPGHGPSQIPLRFESKRRAMSPNARMESSVLFNAFRFGVLLLSLLVGKFVFFPQVSCANLCAKSCGTQVFFAVISRLVLHPLSKFPGPLAAKITNGYGGFHALKRRLHLETYKNHLRYGTGSHFPDASILTELGTIHRPRCETGTKSLDLQYGHCSTRYLN